MSWQRIDEYGHSIISYQNEEWCDHGTRCYHRIKRGRNAHEFQSHDMGDYCKKCDGRF